MNPKLIQQPTFNFFHFNEKFDSSPENFHSFIIYVFSTIIFTNKIYQIKNCTGNVTKNRSSSCMDTKENKK